MEPSSLPLLQRYFIPHSQLPEEIRSDLTFGVPLNLGSWNFREDALSSLSSASRSAATFSQEGIKRIEALAEQAKRDVSQGRINSPAVQTVWMDMARYLGHRAVHAQMMTGLLSISPDRLQAAFDKQRRQLTSEGDPILTGAFEGNQQLLSVRPRESSEDRVLKKALQSWVLSEPSSAERREHGQVLGSGARLEALNRLEAMLQDKFFSFGDSPTTRANLQREYKRMKGASLRELRRLVPKKSPPEWNVYSQTVRRLRRVEEVGRIAPSTSWERIKAKAKALTAPQEPYEFIPCMFEGRIVTSNGRPLFRKVPAPNWWDMLPEMGKSVIKYDFPPAMMLDVLGNICTAVAIRSGRIPGHKNALTSAELMGGMIQGDLHRASAKKKPPTGEQQQYRQN